MDPVLQLLLVFVLFHAGEGAVLLLREDLLFIGHGRRYRPTSAAKSPLGDARRALVPLSPFPPFPVAFIAEVPPVTIGPEAVVAMPAQSFGGRARPVDGAEPLDAAQLEGAFSEGRTVFVSGRGSRGRPEVLARTSSPASARALAARLRAFSKERPEERREAFEARLRSAFDLEALRQRKAVFERETRWLSVLGPVTLVALLGTLYGVFHVPFVFAHWPMFGLACLGLLLHLALETWAAHRRLYPGLWADRALKALVLLLVPASAARARALVARDLFVGFHPLAVARVLLEPRSFEALSAEAWRDLKHPLGHPSLAAQPTLDAVRRALLEAHRALILSAGLDPVRLEAAPAREGDARSFCPRCHAQYAEPEGVCEECPGVGRLPFHARDERVAEQQGTELRAPTPPG